jgi:ketosteroid isomerase-like protein
MTEAATFAQVAEGVRATIAAYAQALDDGRTDDLVATFCPDGTCVVPGGDPIEGHDAMRLAFARWKPRQPQRHVVVNTLVTSWGGDEAAATSDVVFMLKQDSGWAVMLVGRYDDIFHLDDGIWRLHRREATFL